jgi:flagellar biosynthetic protein FliQ
VLLAVLIVGILVSIFQAATQINEATLTFVPKLLAAVAVMGIAGPWMLTTLVEYLRSVLLSLPSAAFLSHLRPRAMISLSEAQLMAWLTPVLWPFIRVLALFSSMPVLGQRNVPDPSAHRAGVLHRARRGRHRVAPPAAANVPLDSPGRRSCW